MRILRTMKTDKNLGYTCSIISGRDALTRRDMKTWTLIRDLEEAVFNLKEHLLSVDASSHSSQTDRTNAALAGKLL